METFVSLLRGVNVSGKNKIKMDSLRRMYEDAGFTRVRSYIQSGNVIFESELSDPVALEAKIHAAIADTYGFDVVAIIRRREDLGRVIDGSPFAGGSGIDPKRLAVTFLAGDPPDPGALVVDTSKTGTDEYALVGREVYLYCPDGYGNTKLSNVFWEKKLGLSATTRNWNSVNKLYELAEPLHG